MREQPEALAEPAGADWSEAFGSGRSDRNSACLAFVVSLLIHLGLLATLPYFLDVLPLETPVRKAVTVRLERLVEPPRYIEANPAAPEKPPIDPRFDSFADRRAAEETPDPDSHSPLPQLDGAAQNQKVIESSEETVVEVTPAPAQAQTASEPSSPVEPTPVVETMVPPVEAVSPIKPEQDGGLPGGAPTDSPETSTENVTAENEAARESVAAGQQRITLPRPRVPLALRLPPAPLGSSSQSASAQGLVSADTRLSDFGVYAQQMMEAISRRWHNTIQPLDLGSELGKHVVVAFELLPDGSIRNLRIVDRTAGDAATYAVLDAVESRAPYGPWTAEMRRVLGDSVVRTFRFFYR